ncbi:MAG: nicotinate phosphoribosyltransferase [Planctomycetes bacterium]|nr:nicotinate phosphoribosyltransferase [Planctomycetota bacterium]
MEDGKAVRGRGGALLTDLYELTMAHGYWKLDMAAWEAVFFLSFRESPFGGDYCVACGLAPLIDFLEDFRFLPADLAYLDTLTGADGRRLFSAEFLEYLGALRLACDVDAVPEGTLAFAQEPLVRVRGPLLQAQLLETALMNVLSFQTLVATKAARVVGAAGDGSVLEFGLRRAQGMDGGLAASRAAYVGGCSATSNVLAGKLFGIPVRGTHAHSWVMSFADELAAFDAYARVMPNNCIFLVDTYDTEQGVSHAIQAARRLDALGHRLLGIRLDSGDLAALSTLARRMLDEAGLSDALIVASGDLDEREIERLKRRGARIDVWGVGTRLVTAFDQPALGSAYKLSALRGPTGQWHDTIKVSEQSIKTSLPGTLQTRRYWVGESPVGDIIFDERRGMAEPPEAVDDGGGVFRPPAGAVASDVLVPVYRGGHLVYRCPSIHDSRQSALDQVAHWRQRQTATGSEGAYPVGLERSLDRRKREMVLARGGGRP